METLLKAIHILCMTGAFGALAAVQFGLTRDDRCQSSTVAGPMRLANLLLAAGFLAGLVVFILAMRGATDAAPLPEKFHMLVGIKFLLIFAVGGLAGISSAKMRKGMPDKAGNLRIAAIILLAVAALLGTLIRPAV